MARAHVAVESFEGRRLMALSVPAGFVDEAIASGLSAPTCAEFLPDGRVLITEQGGTLRVVKDRALLPIPVLQIDVDSRGERGLLGVAADPDFADNHFFYVYATTGAAPFHNRVIRYRLDGDVAADDSATTILDLDPLSSATNHNGGAIHFGADGKLYVGVGENATPSNAQSLNNRLGKLLRINKDGSIPTDNPFFDTATGDNRAIWALGLRNPFSFAVQPGTGRVFINDVGQSTFEEVDVGRAGANYGWPTTEGPTSDSRFVSPLYSYTHDDGSTAITAGVFYDPPTPAFPAKYVGSYFFGDLAGGYIKRLKLSGATATVLPFATGLDALVDLDVGADGALYYLDIGTGEFRRVRALTAAPTLTVSGPKAGTRFDAGKTYTFTARAAAFDNTVIPGKRIAWTVEYVDGTNVELVLSAKGNSIKIMPLPSRRSVSGFYRLTATAKDSAGASTTVVRGLRAHVVKVTVRTSVVGTTASINGQPPRHAQTVRVVAGTRLHVSTQSHQTVGAASYVLTGWSDGVRKAGRVVVVPAVGGVLEARFRKAP